MHIRYWIDNANVNAKIERRWLNFGSDAFIAEHQQATEKQDKRREVSKVQKRALALIKVSVSATLIAESGKSHLQRRVVSSDKVIHSSDLLFDQLTADKINNRTTFDYHGIAH